MASLGITLNPNEYEERRGYEALPAGEYQLHAIEADSNPHNNGSGVWFQFEVLSGEYAGRQFRHFINNIVNTGSEQAQQIAREELAEYCRAIGISAAPDTDVFLFQPFTGKVRVMPAGTDRKTGYVRQNAQNNMGKYSPPDGTPVTTAQTRPANGNTTPAPSRQAPPPASTAPKAGRPWATPKQTAA